MDLMTYALCKGNGGGGSSNKFIVTLTPTASDYSGDMDKTPEEITTAVAQGRDIEFSIPMMNASVKATSIVKNGQYAFVAANIVYNMGGTDVLMSIVTSDSTDAYYVTVYSLSSI